MGTPRFSWGLLGRQFRASEGYLGISWGRLWSLGGVWDASWDPLEAKSEPLRGNLGPSWKRPDGPGGDLDASGDHLGTNLGLLAAFLGLLEVSARSQGTIFLKCMLKSEIYKQHLQINDFSTILTFQGVQMRSCWFKMGSDQLMLGLKCARLRLRWGKMGL